MNLEHTAAGDRPVRQQQKPKMTLVVYLGLLATLCVGELDLSGWRRGDPSYEDMGTLGNQRDVKWWDSPINGVGVVSTEESSSSSPLDETVHVLYGLHGNKTGFLDQWEVNLKSTLLNAPLDNPLHIHILVNSDAEQAIRVRLAKARLGEIRDERTTTPQHSSSSTPDDRGDASNHHKNNTNHVYFRQPIRITIYNVETYHGEWTAFLTQKFRGKDLDGAYPMGVYYRLLAYKVILPYWRLRQQKDAESPDKAPGVVGRINSILYMDADVVVLSNLNDLWRNVIRDEDHQQQQHTTQTTVGVSQSKDTSHTIGDTESNSRKLPIIYQWSATWPNSGFAVYYLEHIELFWELLDELPEIVHTNDQNLLVAVAKAFPQIAAKPLPKEWDTHMGHGWRPDPHTLLHGQDRVGMAHFTGRPPAGESYMDTNQGVLKYCIRSKKCSDSKRAQQDYMKTWGLVDYYVRIPWHYVRYLGESQIPIGQHPDIH